MDPEQMAQMGGGMPQGAPAAPMAPGAAPVGGQEMPADPAGSLKEMMVALDQKMADLKTKVDQGAQLDEEQRMEALKYLFELLQEQGVDPNDQEAVGQFLNQLQETNPDIYEVFESALNSILGEVQGAEEAQGENPMGATPSPAEQAPREGPSQTFPSLGGASLGGQAPIG